MTLENLQEKLGYKFKNIKYLRLALTHSSYTNEHDLSYSECNERLEFLGDAVLELASSDFLFKHYANQPEGDLTKIRASLVCEQALAEVARGLGVGECMFFGHGEELNGGRDRDSSISDTLEAIIGAIYLDSGFTAAKEFVDRFIMTDIETRHLFFDSKTILQEMVQAGDMGRLRYELVKTEGPDHEKNFTSRVLIGDVEEGRGSGKSKKLSEQQAAYEAIIKLKGR